jgi:hypothetical protein
MTRFTKVLFLSVLTVVVVGFDLTIGLAAMARSKGVERAAIVDSTMIGTLAADAALAYAVRVPVSEAAFADEVVLTTMAPDRRMAISGRGAAEVVYRATLPGLQVHVGYALHEGNLGRELTVTTVFHYRHALARLYAGPIRLVQWGVQPYLVARLAG